MLGIMYFNGQGVKQDFKMALRWFQAASRFGHVHAYYNLVQIYATGTSVLRSCTLATELYKKCGPWSNLFTKAFHLYNQGHIERAFMIYI